MTRVGPGAMIRAIKYADRMAGAGGDTDRYAHATIDLADHLQALSTEHRAQLRHTMATIVEMCDTVDLIVEVGAHG